MQTLDSKLQECSGTSVHLPLEDACQWHSDLSTSLNNEEATTPADWLQFRRFPDTFRDDKGFQEKFIQNADTYRALAGLSLYIAKKLPQGSPKREILQHMHLQANLIHRLQTNIYEFLMNSTNEEIASHYPNVQAWMVNTNLNASHTTYAQDQGGLELETITIDKEALQLEEDELIYMASTPTPLEAMATQRSATHSSAEEANNPVHGRLEGPIDEVMTGVVSREVEWCNCGIIKLVKEPERWWAITSKTTAEFLNGQTCVLDGVMANKSSLIVSTLELDLGNQANAWWERISICVQQLKDIDELVDRAHLAWR